MEQSLIKTNFVGRDGFRWWIGQIAPDPVQAPQTKGVATTGGRYSKDGPPPFSNRYKVRIMGYHPYNTIELSDEDLPWAQVVSPPGYGTGSAGLFKTIRFQQGDTVIGFFMDGDNAQIPMILGALGNSQYKAEEGEPLPFRSFTGYTRTMKKPSEGVLAESNSTGAIDPESPKNLSSSDAKKVADSSGNNNKAFLNSAVGKVIHLGSGESKTVEAINKMKTGVEGFTQELDNLKSRVDVNSAFGQDKINGLIQDKASALAGVGSGIVGGMSNKLYENMGPMLNGGLVGLYDDVYMKVFAATMSPAMANKAGVAAQASMLSPIGDIEGLLPCLTNQVTNNLTNSLAAILGSVANNVFSYADCVGDQVTGAIMNDVIGQISEGMASAMGGIGKLMKFMGDFSVEGLLRNGVDALLGMAGMGDCGVSPSPHTGAAKYRVGFGPIVQDAPDLSAIIKDANTAKAISDAAALAGVPLDGVQDILGGFSLLSGGISNAASALGGGIGDGIRSCSSALPTLCEPPKINIFGGGGRDAEAIPFYGNIVGDVRKTGSIIGIKMTNPGNGYLYPPFVEIVDSCKQGYGAIARATVKDGKVNEIYMVSEGENYPIKDGEPPIISNVTIINPGSVYEKGDTVTDDFDNEYDVKISSGSIVKVTPINSKDITDIPTLNVKSTTGSGAILKANLDVRPEFQGEVKQVIDCPET